MVPCTSSNALHLFNVKICKLLFPGSDWGMLNKDWFPLRIPKKSANFEYFFFYNIIAVLK